MTRAYTLFCAIFLLAQGASTLVARLVPAVDAAFPALLETTRMMPAHSTLHIVTALIAWAAFAKGERASGWFALLFGLFYLALGLVGWLSHASLGLGLQPFDHPFHVLLGALGVIPAWLRARRSAA